jgi:hypothetical protein
MNNGRDAKSGQFTAGNPGGPGRPRRAVERQYLAALSDDITLDDWKDIVKAAVTAAKQGDGKARDWLTRFLVGSNPLSLTDLAADETAELGAERDIIERMAKRAKDRNFVEVYSGADLDRAEKQFRRTVRPEPE